MYTQSITRSHRTAFFLAIDCSGSMAEPIHFRGGCKAKSEVVATIANELLFELIERARRSDGVRDYYDIAVLGYHGDDEVTPLLADRAAMHTVCELAAMEPRIRTELLEYRLPDGGISLREIPTPCWVEPRAEGQTLHDTAASYTALRRLKGHRWCSNLFEGLVCVEDETGYGFVDASNRVVIPSHFLWANDFHEGRAEVQTAEGMGLIDKQGGYVIPPHYEIVEYDPATSLSLVRRAGNWARFDYLGRQLTRFAPLAELGEEEPAADAREPLPVG